MAKIQIIAPEGTRFTIGGRLITDKKPISVNGGEYRIRKYLGDGSVLLYEEEEKPKKRRGRRAKKDEPVIDKPEGDDIKIDELLADLPDESSEDKKEESEEALITEE